VRPDHDALERVKVVLLAKRKHRTDRSVQNVIDKAPTVQISLFLA
jgi:hypothetical protein